MLSLISVTFSYATLGMIEGARRKNFTIYLKLLGSRFGSARKTLALAHC